MKLDKNKSINIQCVLVGARNKCYITSFVIGNQKIKSKCQKLKLTFLKALVMHLLYCQHLSRIHLSHVKRKSTKPENHSFNNYFYVNVYQHMQSRTRTYTPSDNNIYSCHKDKNDVIINHLHLNNFIHRSYLY